MNFSKRKAIFRALCTDQHSAFPHLSAAAGEMSRPQEGTRAAVRTEVFSGHMSISQKVQFSWMPSWHGGWGQWQPTHVPALWTSTRTLHSSVGTSPKVMV